MGAAGRLLGMAAIAALAACAPKPPPAPQPVEPAPPPTAPPTPPPAEAASDWPDLPVSPGEWSYGAAGGGPEARFGGGAASFTLRCDLQRRQVILSRPGAPAGQSMTVRTSHGARTLAAEAALAGADPFLDAIAFSRGRFAVETAGLPDLIVPAWPEPGRVVEDCRP